MSIYINRDIYYPNLNDNEHRVTSPTDPNYNCMAWAVGESDRWWEPSEDPTDAYWPPDAPREYVLEAYVSVFTRLGYEPCADGSIEPGFEKVAIYTDSDQTFSHVAKQGPDGRWSSKMGILEDIEHNFPEVVEGRVCGTVNLFLRRRT